MLRVIINYLCQRFRFVTSVFAPVINLYVHLLLTFSFKYYRFINIFEETGDGERFLLVFQKDSL